MRTSLYGFELTPKDERLHTCTRGCDVFSLDVTSSHTLHTDPSAVFEHNHTVFCVANANDQCCPQVTDARLLSVEARRPLSRQIVVRDLRATLSRRA
eukprot:COSAG02_NODE_213_length_28704_cov_69.390177_5_plen_97_part_00